MPRKSGLSRKFKRKRLPNQYRSFDLDAFRLYQGGGAVERGAGVRCVLNDRHLTNLPNRLSILGLGLSARRRVRVWDFGQSEN